MTDSHDYHDEALGSLLEAGAVKLCPAHPDVWINQGDPQAERRAYAIFTNRLKEMGMPGSANQDLGSAVKLALDTSAEDECPVCGSR